MGALYKEPGERYFAAANTNRGFKSYFDDIFDKDSIDRIYILKGGPGVGKSTFMKKAGAMAKELGLSIEYFHCSSDPDSLDGIIIKEKKIAVLDGTSPHTYEPKLAGAREIIINLGKAWKSDGLFDNRWELLRISKEKSDAYKECYKLLNAKRAVDTCIYNLISPYILETKIEKCAKRLTQSLFKNKQKQEKGNEQTRLLCAISCKGKIRLDTFENMSEYCIFVKDNLDESTLSSTFLEKVYQNAKALGQNLYKSYNPENPSLINGLYFPDIKVSLTLYDDSLVEKCDKSFKRCKIINCRRFCDERKLVSLRPLRRFYAKLSKSLEEKALGSLKKAGEIHIQLEKIYGDFTNYKTVEKITDEYINSLF